MPTISAGEEIDETQVRLGENELLCSEKVSEELCRWFLQRNAKALFYYKPCLASLLFLPTNFLILHRMAQKEMLVILTTQSMISSTCKWVKNILNQIEYILNQRMGLSLSKHVVLMIKFYLLKNLTEDQISLFMADINPSLFCPAKFQAHV